MKIAFLISAHTDAEHLKRLIHALPTDAWYYIHVDRKADLDSFKKVVLDGISSDSTQKQPHICFLEERYNIMWGSFKQVRCQMALLKKALQDQPDYLISMSGLDYPLWSNDQIKTFLQAHRSENMLQAFCLANHPEHARLYQEYRFLNEHVWKYGSLGSKFRVFIRHFVKLLGVRKQLVVKGNGVNRKLYKGGSWWGICRELAEEVLSVWENEPSFCRYFHTAFGPDETFVHTIAFNSRFKDRCIEEDGTHVKLEDLSPLTYIEYTDQIKVFTATDYDKLITSGKMFCRKVITGKSDQLMDMIDEHRQQTNAEKEFFL